MVQVNPTEISLYEEAKAGFSSLIQQTASVFVGFVVMLLITGGTPSSLIVVLSFSLGTAFVAWSEQKRVTKMTTIPVEEETSVSTSIRIIGDRASGKTTYLASLARYPGFITSNPVQEVTPLDEKSRSLALKASNIIEQGLQLEATAPGELPDYSLRIVLRDKFQHHISSVGSQNHPAIFNLHCKDYPGEFFNKLSYASSDSLLDSYIEDFTEANGIMLLLDGTSYQADREYARSLERLIDLFEQRLRSTVGRLRIALVITKDEMAELYVWRHNPQGFIQEKFSHLYQTVESHQKLGFIQVEYFSTSAFGWLDDPSQPNSVLVNRGRRGTFSVLKNPAKWKPVGLVAPIYWLATGRRNKDLEVA